MNNSQLAAAFISMVNGKQEKKSMQTANNMRISVQGENLVLMSYHTPIAVYNSTFNYVVCNVSFLSAPTAKHQAKLNYSLFDCPVSRVNYFYGWGCAATDLLEQAKPLYYYARIQYVSKNNRIYYRWTLYKAATKIDKIINGVCDFTEIHRYISEQAAKDEMSRLNRLATPNRVRALKARTL